MDLIANVPASAPAIATMVGYGGLLPGGSPLRRTDRRLE
jgi:hypothetical protein